VDAQLTVKVCLLLAFQLAVNSATILDINPQ
jgi:hypothetical protein